MSPAPRKTTPVALRVGAVVAGLVLLAAAGYFLLVQPQKAKVNKLSKEIAAMTQQINDRTAQSRKAAGLSKILVADYFKLTTAMPDDPQVPELYLQLNTIARDTGVSFDGITPGTVVDASAYQVIPFALTFQGDFLHLSDFLYRLQSLVLVENGKLLARGRLFTIDQVSFAEGAAGFPNIAASVQVNAFVYGHPIPVASTGGTSTTGTDTTGTTTSPGGTGTSQTSTTSTNVSP